MTDYAALIAERFPVRKTKAQKEAFRAWLTSELKALGCRPREETNGRLGAKNVLVGDPEHSAVLIAAHYDTPARWLLTDLWFPRNIPLWALWQLVHILLMLLPAVAVYLLIWQVSGGNAQLGLWGLVLGYVGLLLVSQFGPANPVNRGEDLDVASMLTLMASLPEEDRAKAAWLFADQGSRGGSGAKAWAKEHPLPAYTRLTVVFARLGGGDRLLAAHTALAAKCTAFGALTAALTRGEAVPVVFTGTKGCTVRGDRRAFRCGISLTGCRKNALAGLWADGGHTPRDRDANALTADAAVRALAGFLTQIRLNTDAKK